jgi:hypothetical protein
MGERNCAYEGCNALEFRTSGFCLRHKNENPVEKKLIMADTIVTSSSESPSFSWWKMVGLLYIAVPIILFLNILTHKEPPGAIAPTGLLNIPCFVCSLIPLLIVVSMRRIGEVRKYPGGKFSSP